MALTPMWRQYHEIKEQHPGCILFFRLGDFYEMFFDDAQQVSRELELTLTGRDCGEAERAPMCGVPYHSAEAYIARLIAAGHKVALCDQTEDPAAATGLVRREVTRVITPGTVIEDSMLEEGRSSFLCTLFLSQDKTQAGLCFVDASTGQVLLTAPEGEGAGGGKVVSRVISELGRLQPREVLWGGERDAEIESFLYQRLNVKADFPGDAAFDFAAGERRVLGVYGAASLAELGLADAFPMVRALGCALGYLARTQMAGLERLARPEIYADLQYMRLDAHTRRNLELTESLRARGRKGSLLAQLDFTKTAMGKRLLRQWLEQPLLSVTPIRRRQGAVARLVEDIALREELLGQLAGVYDFERIMTRVVYGSAGARELRSLAQAIGALAPLKAALTAALAGETGGLLADLAAGIDPLDDVFAWIDAALVEEPPLSVREGGLIRAGYSGELDALRADRDDGEDIIARIEAQEKERTGIKSLKVGFNRVFGYYIEISKAHKGDPPEGYIRKQTLSTGERYITQELKELEARVLGAKDRGGALEYDLFVKLRLAVAGELHRIQATARAVASLDVLCAFAQAAVRYGYVCPEVDLSGAMDIEAGRHPVVEALSDAPFVPNDTAMDTGERRVMLITGPNMAGKSTYMRQVALMALMAQIGSFVPAARARLGVVDSVFTRVGASDDLAAGQSTFMVEMSEVAHILKNATRQSLIVFDEIGRGTSTFDGMSIARAVLEHVASTRRLGAKTLFATHYHELTGMADEIDGVNNFNIAVKKRGDDITFLRRIVPGPADDSYGIEVAKLAGVPEGVVARAKEILRELEGQETVRHGRDAAPGASAEDGERSEQLSFLADSASPVLARLRELDVNTLTPLEALQELYELCREARG